TGRAKNMGHWEDIRREARTWRASAFAMAGGDPSAMALLVGADHLTGLSRVGLRTGDALLDGGEAELDLNSEKIWFDRDVDPKLALFYQAHEFAHFWLHREQISCSTGALDPEAAEEPVPLGVQRVEGYGPEER